MRKFIVLITILLFIGCQQQSANLSQSDDNHIKRFVIFYTNDEHGWMEPNDNNGGAPGLMGLWKRNDGFQIDGPFLVLSGGDMWTGPAISTLTSGKSMVEVMNTLRKRLSEMDFPILAANIREKESGSRADFTLPYIIKEVNDVSIGIIGLTTISVPTTTKPANVVDYIFTPYDEELRDIVPQVKSEGAELLLLIGHLCQDEMRELAPLANEFEIPVIGGGHCHQLFDGHKYIFKYTCESGQHAGHVY
jgi:2',3'-cyclic-nucleotide 2'-phosphodiesterase/3'-nucleotidase